MQTSHAIRHHCGLSCAVKAEIDDSDGRCRLVSPIGDRDDTTYHGYSCTKGRDLPELLGHANRLLRPLKRNPDGGFERIGSEEAIAEAEPGLRRGGISMTHCSGSPGERGEPGDPGLGSSTGRSSSHEVDNVEPFSGISRVSSIPVDIEPESAA